MRPPRLKKLFHLDRFGSAGFLLKAIVNAPIIRV